MLVCGSGLGGRSEVGGGQFQFYVDNEWRSKGYGAGSRLTAWPWGSYSDRWRRGEANEVPT